MRKILKARYNAATEQERSEALYKLLEAVEELEQDDFFGTEGLLHFLGWDD